MGWGAVIAAAVSAAAGIGSSLMKDEGGGGGGRMPTLTPGQRSLLNSLTGVLQGQLGRGVEEPPGPSQLQQQLFSGLSGEDTSGAGGAIQAGSNYLNKLLSSNYDPSAGQEYWQESFKKPMMQQWEQDIMPSIAEKYGGAGAISSSGFNRAMGQAGTNMQTQLGAQLSDILYKGQQARKERQMTGVGLSQGLAGLLSQAGGQQRNIGLQQFESQQPWGNPWLRLLPTALHTRAFENYRQQPYQKSTWGSGLMSMLGRLGSMYAYSQMGSGGGGG